MKVFQQKVFRPRSGNCIPKLGLIKNASEIMSSKASNKETLIV